MLRLASLKNVHFVALAMAVDNVTGIRLGGQTFREGSN